jgi:hypothetical protein
LILSKNTEGLYKGKGQKKGAIEWHLMIFYNFNPFSFGIVEVTNIIKIYVLNNIL